MEEIFSRISVVVAWVMLIPWSFLCYWYIAEIFRSLFNKSSSPIKFRSEKILELKTPFFLFLIEGIIIGIITHV